MSAPRRGTAPDGTGAGGGSVGWNATHQRSTGLIEAALDYARTGWRVFPVAPRAKLPLIPKRDGGHGCLDATTDPAIIARWWERWPAANIGLATGHVFDVLDVDGAAGTRSLVRLIDANGCLPSGAAATTGGGGAHLWFRATGLGNRAGLAPGLDWRGKGGYIVASPSVHPSGRRYAWDLHPNEWPIPPAPEWLGALVAPREVPVRPPGGLAAPGASINAPAGRRAAYGRTALEAECGRVVLAPVGTRNATLNTAAFALGQLVAGGVLDVTEAVTALATTGVGAGLGNVETERTILSGLAAGMARPRTVAA